MALVSDQSRRWWRPRFSLRTLVLGVLVYASLWTATEIYGGRAFRERIEARTEELRRTTVAWNCSRSQEGVLWAQEGDYFPTGPQEAGVGSVPAVPVLSSSVVAEVQDCQTDVRAWCEVETLAVAPFVLRFQYTCVCVDAYGRSLPIGDEGAAAPDGQGLVFWCFGLNCGPVACCSENCVCNPPRRHNNHEDTTGPR